MRYAVSDLVKEKMAENVKNRSCGKIQMYLLSAYQQLQLW